MKAAVRFDRMTNCRPASAVCVGVCVSVCVSVCV